MASVVFTKYENVVTGDNFFALKEDAVRKVIEGEEFIEVTNDVYNITKNTVFMVKIDSLHRAGEVTREN